MQLFMITKISIFFDLHQKKIYCLANPSLMKGTVVEGVHFLIQILYLAIKVEGKVRLKIERVLQGVFT